MGETIHSNPPAPSRSLPRLLAFVVLPFILAVGAVAWVEVGSWRQMERLEREFAGLSLEAFHLGTRLREGMQRLNGAVFRFQLSGDIAEREAFHEESRLLSEWIGRTKSELFTPRERQLVERLELAFAVYREDMTERLERGLRGIRKDTAGLLNQELAERSEPVLALADQLVAAQQASWDGFFDHSREAMSALQRWLVISLLLLVAMLAVIGALLYRSLVTPLRLRLSQSHGIIERQEKLASLGILATGVAHEIRNPLTAIKFRVFSLRRALADGGVDQEDLTIIQSEIQRLERIVSDFLQFARPSEPKLADVEVDGMFEAVQDLLRSELEERAIQLVLHRNRDLSVRADAQQLRQVLINLVQNAADGIGRDGTITLSARQGASAAGRGAKAMVRIEVADDGAGIPPEVEPRLFDPFFSTKEGGTGLGLPIAARILEKHGGIIEYVTHPGRGTTFSIVLPKESDHGSEDPSD